MTSTRRQQRLAGQLIHQHPPEDIPLYLSQTKVATIAGLTSFKPPHPRYPILEFSRPSLVVYSSMFRRLSSNIKMIPLEKLFLFASSFFFFFPLPNSPQCTKQACPFPQSELFSRVSQT